MCSLMDDVWDTYWQDGGNTKDALERVVLLILSDVDKAACGDAISKARLRATMDYLNAGAGN